MQGRTLLRPYQRNPTAVGVAASIAAVSPQMLKCRRLQRAEASNGRTFIGDNLFALGSTSHCARLGEFFERQVCDSGLRKRVPQAINIQLVSRKRVTRAQSRNMPRGAPLRLPPLTTELTCWC